MPRPEVRDTGEYQRIAVLPRRKLTLEDGERWSEILTPELRRPGSAARLRPEQALVLAEAADCSGAFACLPVGKGKTLVCEMLPRVLGAKRPMLVLPASLVDKTLHDRAELAKDWTLASPPPRITTMQELAPESGATLIERYDPDLIIIDESDEGSNTGASAVRRIDRHKVKRQEACPIVTLTGSPTRLSIMAYWHLLMWTLGPDAAPLPALEHEAKEWASALDEQRRQNARRTLPGPLGATRQAALTWYRHRLAETPGVLIFDGDSCDQPLTINVRLAREDAVLDRLYEKFLKQDLDDPETPDGLIVSDPLSRWRIDGWLGLGVIQRYKVPPPEEWRMARRVLSRFVRNAIDASTHTARPLDTEAQVLKRFAEHPVVLEWKRVEPTFTPETEAVWLSTSGLDTAKAWLAESREPSILWLGAVEFAQRLARETGLSYYASGGRDQHKRPLHLAPRDRHMLCSWHACKRGFNLQPWRRNGVMLPPQSAKYLEQMFGRPHRSGQDRGVTFDVIATSGGTIDGFAMARREAQFAQRSVGMTQKILRAAIHEAEPDVTHSNRFRWARRDDE